MKNNLKSKIKNISLLHTKTTKFIDLEKHDLYDSNFEYLDNIMKYYLDLHDGIDEMELIRDDYYLLLINISKIYKLINKCIEYLNKWFQLDIKKYREVSLIYDYGRGNYLLDLVSFYKENYNNLDFNIKELFDLYDLNYQIGNDYYLFFCLLGKIDKIKFSKDVENNMQNINELINYVEKTYLFLEEYKDY